MVLVRSEADVSIGTYHQQRNAINAELIGCGAIDSSHLDWRIGGSSDSEGLCKQGRILRDLLYRGMKVYQFLGICDRTGEQHQSMARPMGELMESARRRIRPFHGDVVGQAVAGSEAPARIPGHNGRVRIVVGVEKVTLISR